MTLAMTPIESYPSIPAGTGSQKEGGVCVGGGGVKRQREKDTKKEKGRDKETKKQRRGIGHEEKGGKKETDWDTKREKRK